MAISPAMFASAAIADLRARTEYEAWLLEAVYDISDQRIAVENVDELVYPPSGGPPAQTIYAVGNINLGDWRPGFLAAGAPLIFVTEFKLLDMLLEWVLTENGHMSSHKFVQKISALKGAVQFPSLIASRPWLQDRLVALYEALEPLRGTIIHARHFRSTDGGIEVSSTKGGSLGPAVSVSSKDLRSLAVLLVSLLRYLEGTWTLDLFREKRIRHALDGVVHLHSLAPLGQLPPAFLNVCVYLSEGDSIHCDLDRIRRDVAAKRPHEDVMFDLRVVVIAPDGSRATAYLIPWVELQDEASQLRISTADLAPFASAVPSGLDLKVLARDLAKRGELHR